MTRNGTPAVLRLLATVALALSASACASPDGPHGAPAPSRAADAEALRQALHLPAGTKRLLADAEQELVRTCMARRGFSYFYDAATAEAFEAAAGDRLREMHRDDVERARREGFGNITEERTGSKAERAEAGYLKKLTPRQREAWSNTLGGPPDQPTIKVEVPGVGVMESPASGCLAQARTELYGAYEKWIRADTFVNSRFLPVNDEVKKSPDYARVTREWSSCMRDRGREFTTPDDALEAAAAESRAGAGIFRKPDHGTAVASAECDRKVGLSRTHRELFDRFTVGWAERHRAEVADYRRLNAEAAARAGRLAGGDPTTAGPAGSRG
ncbi:hypothetical protein [Streptomyces sp. SP18CS02]|uniref:hypothetical protein n=1 Tax=Streptomyces sp. SP18CS02 TaxID=3002531 RepID=UPI002E76C4F0|nr:hypothetical protein [Streptomyces sp. SP18CS02]MEE1753370.1 hypothetical protein [Streptomyces sp. SP18CS02]